MPASISTAVGLSQVVHHAAAQVVYAVGVGDVSVPGLALVHLLGSAMVEADLGNNVDDLFTIEPAVRCVRHHVFLGAEGRC